METIIRNVEEKDMDFVLELNRVNVEVLSPMDEEKFRYFLRVSDMFQVAEADGEPVAFLIALREGIPDYTSENYIWFSKQYETFLYVDRIVIDEKARGLGIGRQLYEGVFERAAQSGIDKVTAEIDIIPYNEPSLKYHEAMGFEEVGQQVIRGGEIKVSLQVREMAGILMTKDQIKEVIPHREPILMIDEILEMVPGESIKARLYLDPNENYFKGHFPGEPVMPGVLTVESMAQTADVLLLSTEKYAGTIPYFVGIDGVRFTSKIEPGDTIIIEANIEEEYPEKAIAICNAVVYNDGRKSAVGKVTLAMR